MATRREVLVSGAVLAAGVACNRTARAEEADGTLENTARQSGRHYGAAVRLDQILGNRDFERAILQECEYLTPEIALRWSEIEPSRGQLSFSAMDDLCAYASTHDKKVRGHSLLWHASVPSWAEEMLTHGDWRPIHNFFASAIPRFGGSIEQWDVINEPIEPGPDSQGLRPNAFLRGFGSDYIARALHDARLFAPHGRLLINEFGLDYDIPAERNKRRLFLGLLERLRKSDVPLDGVGMQAHLDLSKGPFVPKVLADFLKAIRELGLFVIITELDVKEFDLTLPVEERDRRVAGIVGSYLDVALAEPAVKAVNTWGLSDLFSWLEITAEDLSRYPGAWKEGSGPGFNRGLPLDSSQRPKLMYWEMLSAFNRAR